MFSLRVFDKCLPGAPRTKPVKAALATFVKLGLAERCGEGDERFRITYRKLRGGSAHFFAKKLAGGAKGNKKAKAAGAVRLTRRREQVPPFTRVQTTGDRIANPAI
jgi:hypothetical protein